MIDYPLGCGGCGSACCWRLPWGRPPWTPAELNLPDMIERFNGDEGRARDELETAMQRFGEPERPCICAVDGRCSIEVVYGYDAKPVGCKADRILGRACVAARKRKGLPV